VVERSLGDLLVRAERAGLAKELVDQGGLPMVDVRDDRNVPDLRSAHRALSVVWPRRPAGFARTARRARIAMLRLSTLATLAAAAAHT
jgi:hypothetical protein